MKRHLSFKNGSSHKFWKIETLGKSFTVTYGKNGSAGTKSMKTFPSKEICEREALKLVVKKKKEGYSSNTPAKQQKDRPRFHIEKGNLLVIESNANKGALQQLVKCTSNIQKQILGHLSYKAKNDTIQLIFKVRNKRLNEKTFFKTLPKQKELISLAKQFIKQLTKYNKDHQTTYTHEELETGTFAIEYLLNANLNNLFVYINFLKSIDLDHTVEQPSLVDRLTKIYSREKLSPLYNFLRESGGQVFDNTSVIPEFPKQSPLHEAAQANDIKKIRSLLTQAETNDLHALDEMNGYTPLHYSKGSIEIAELLLQAGADVNCQNTKGETILHNSLSHDGYYKKAFIEYILNCGADIRLMDNTGGSAIHHVQTIDGLKLVLARGGSLDDRDFEGNTLLHRLAPWNYEANLFIEVLKQGADANAMNNDGRNPLFFAVTHGNAELAKILYHAGADPNLKDKNGESARDIVDFAFFSK